MRRLLSMLLAAAALGSSVLMLASCSRFTPAAEFSDPDVYDKIHNGGTIVTGASTGGVAGALNTAIYSGNAQKDYRDSKIYTYNDYVGATTSLNWSPHSWETSSDSYILGYQSMGFYDFVLNSDLSGYSVTCEMASSLPVDVTDGYVGRYGVKAGERAKAWKISLNPNARWNDGTPINADSYIYSMKQLLDPLALNRRADSYYAGDFVIYNAKAYLYGGKTVALDNFDGGGYYFDSLEDLAKGDDGVYRLNGGVVYIATARPLNRLGGYGLDAYIKEYGAESFDTDAYNSLRALDGDGDGLVPATDEAIGYIKRAVGAESEAEFINYSYVDVTYAKTPFEEVGIVKTGDYELVIVLENEMEMPDFYMVYNLSSTWLVKEDLYEASKKYFDAQGRQITDPAGYANAASVTNTYATSLETNASYGPYVLDSFQADAGFSFKRNENWYGYSDGRHNGQFQTDRINVRVISAHETALQSFLAGDIDSIALDAEDMESYAASDRVRYTPEDYTTKITFNTDYKKLVSLGNNQQILALSDFRRAFALAIDREAFTSANTASHEPGYGLLNYIYCYNPFTGDLYRESDAAKRALVELYGLTYGEGGDYPTLDAAHEAMTGYDMAAAKLFMQRAYDKAVDAGIYDGRSKIVIDFRVYQNDEAYIKMFNYFDSQLRAACTGTDLEGKVSLTMTVDADYYETMYSGNTGIIFSTWGGSAMSPFSIISQVYTDSSDGSGNQMEVGYRTESIPVRFSVNGEEIEASLKDWADWCGGVAVRSIDERLGRFADYSYDTRCEFFAGVERVYLEGYATTPVYYRNAASLISRKVDMPTAQHLQLVGTGGIRYMTYNYDDSEWAGAKSGVVYR